MKAIRMHVHRGAVAKPPSFNWLLHVFREQLRDEDWRNVALCPPCVAARGKSAHAMWVERMESAFIRRYSRGGWTSDVLSPAGCLNINNGYLFEDIIWFLHLVHDCLYLTVVGELDARATVDPISGTPLSLAASVAYGRLPEEHRIEFNYVYRLLRVARRTGMQYNRSVMVCK